MKKISIIVTIFFAIIVTVIAQSIFTVEQESVVVKTTLSPETAGGLMSSAYIPDGAITLRKQDDGSPYIVISGYAFIEVPLNMATQLVTLPEGCYLTNMTSGQFKRTTNGFETTITVNK